jgi:hypothetical protein
MSNNKQSMKLYTEEEIRKFFTEKYDEGLSIDELIEILTPIELPSDEEIEKANPFVFGSKHLGTRDMDIWELGVTWMRNKIQGGNK